MKKLLFLSFLLLSSCGEAKDLEPDVISGENQEKVGLGQSDDSDSCFTDSNGVAGCEVGEFSFSFPEGWKILSHEHKKSEGKFGFEVGSFVLDEGFVLRTVDGRIQGKDACMKNINELTIPLSPESIEARKNSPLDYEDFLLQDAFNLRNDMGIYQTKKVNMKVRNSENIIGTHFYNQALIKGSESCLKISFQYTSNNTDRFVEYGINKNWTEFFDSFLTNFSEE